MSKDLKCFIITPTGSKDQSLREEVEGIIHEVIKPIILSTEKFENESIFAAHHINSSGSISKQIIKSIDEADLIIANITQLNPNVMYELGVAHSLRKRVILISNINTAIPFDITQQRTIIYRNTIQGTSDLKKELKAAVDEIIVLKEKNIDNPVYDYLDGEKVIEKLTNVPGDNEVVTLLLKVENRLDKLETLITKTNQSHYNHLDDYDLSKDWYNNIKTELTSNSKKLTPAELYLKTLNEKNKEKL